MVVTNNLDPLIVGLPWQTSGSIVIRSCIVVIVFLLYKGNAKRLIHLL